jgi:hypothetical protein
MTGMTSLLPADFADLDSFVTVWAIAGSNARKSRRIASTPAERMSFYDVAMPRLPSALAYLDRFDVDSLDVPQQNLMNMMLMLAHISLAVEKQGANEERHKVNHAHFTITRSTENA